MPLTARPQQDKNRGEDAPHGIDLTAFLLIVLVLAVIGLATFELWAPYLGPLHHDTHDTETGVR